MADLIVLAGCAAVEAAARDGGTQVNVPFTPGRMDASEDQTDAQSFDALRPRADAFRNFYTDAGFMAPEEAMVDKAQLMKLSGPQLTVLVGGLRVLGANAGGAREGVFTHDVGKLTNDFFVNLLDMKTEWEQAGPNLFQGRDRRTREATWTGTRVDLIFGSHSELRALAEVYACADAKEKFVRDFVAAWDKVMNADRMDIARPQDAYSQKLAA